VERGIADGDIFSFKDVEEFMGFGADRLRQAD
jgi:hypothetical protein